MGLRYYDIIIRNHFLTFIMRFCLKTFTYSESYLRKEIKDFLGMYNWKFRFLVLVKAKQIYKLIFSLRILNEKF